MVITLSTGFPIGKSIFPRFLERFRFGNSPILSRRRDKSLTDSSQLKRDNTVVIDKRKVSKGKVPTYNFMLQKTRPKNITPDGPWNSRNNQAERVLSRRRDKFSRSGSHPNMQGTVICPSQSMFQNKVEVYTFNLQPIRREKIVSVRL